MLRRSCCSSSETSSAITYCWVSQDPTAGTRAARPREARPPRCRGPDAPGAAPGAGRPRPRAQARARGRSKGPAPGGHVLAARQWQPPAPTLGTGRGAQLASPGQRALPAPCDSRGGRAGGSPAMVSLRPAPAPARPPGRVAARPPAGLSRAAAGSRGGRAAACGRRGAGGRGGGPGGGGPEDAGRPPAPGARGPAPSAGERLGRCWGPSRRRGLRDAGGLRPPGEPPGGRGGLVGGFKGLSVNIVSVPLSAIFTAGRAPLPVSFLRQ